MKDLWSACLCAKDWVWFWATSLVRIVYIQGTVSPKFPNISEHFRFLSFLNKFLFVNVIRFSVVPRGRNGRRWHK